MNLTIELQKRSDKRKVEQGTEHKNPNETLEDAFDKGTQRVYQVYQRILGEASVPLAIKFDVLARMEGLDRARQSFSSDLRDTVDENGFHTGAEYNDVSFQSVPKTAAADPWKHIARAVIKLGDSVLSTSRLSRAVAGVEGAAQSQARGNAKLPADAIEANRKGETDGNVRFHKFIGQRNPTSRPKVNKKQQRR